MVAAVYYEMVTGVVTGVNRKHITIGPIKTTTHYER